MEDLWKNAKEFVISYFKEDLPESSFQVSWTYFP